MSETTVVEKPAKKTMTDIVNVFRELEELMIEAGGEITPEVESLLDENLTDRDEKLDRYQDYIRHLKAQAEYLKGWEDQLRKRRDSVERAVESMKDRMLWAMDMYGLQKVKTDRHTFWIQESTKLNINDEAMTDKDRQELVESGLAKLAFVPKKREIKDWVQREGVTKPYVSIEKTRGIRAR